MEVHGLVGTVHREETPEEADAEREDPERAKGGPPAVRRGDRRGDGESDHGPDGGPCVQIKSG